MSIRPFLGPVLVALLSCGPARGAGLTIAVDEYGDGVGTIGPGTLRPDPGPGGLPSVLTYTLPFNEVVGDVEIRDAEGLSDVIRFNGNSTLDFYSATGPGQPAVSPADTPTPPLVSYPNLVSGPEFEMGGRSFALYTPLPGQPGYNPDAQPTYLFGSDGDPTGPMPEPSSLLMGATAALAGVGYCGYALAARRLGGWGFRTARRAARGAG